MRHTQTLAEQIDEESFGGEKWPEEFLNARVVFGIKAQGHIGYIGKMLSEGKSWRWIATTINWCPIELKKSWLIEMDKI